MKNYKSIERGEEEDASYNLCTGIFWENWVRKVFGTNDSDA